MKAKALSDTAITSLAIFAPAAVGLAGTAVAVTVFENYGAILFLLLPVLVAFLSAIILCARRPVSWWQAYAASLVSILVLGTAIILVALDGAMCLLMAAPLAAVQAAIGTAIGVHLGRKLARRSAGLLSLFLVASYPGLLGFEQTYQTEPAVHTVTTSLIISAPIERVWDEVIAFDQITAPPSGIFTMGIAYPIRARIEGEGVGAVRHCIFSTGPFIEPITIWEPPYRLEFDVTSNPPAMKEFSPYAHLDTPHLHNGFVSTHGRFRLVETDGQVLLEGTTWYFQRIRPDWYWRPISDQIIHQIHLRVLNQIKASAEARPVITTY